MNKSELINAVAEKAALSKKDSEAAVTCNKISNKFFGFFVSFVEYFLLT